MDTDMIRVALHLHGLLSCLVRANDTITRKRQALNEAELDEGPMSAEEEEYWKEADGLLEETLLPRKIDSSQKRERASR